MFNFLSQENLKKLAADTLAKELHLRNEEYRKGLPTINDAQYDEKLEQLRAIDANHPFLHQVEAEAVSGKIYKHQSPMLSTNKSYKAEDVANWLKKVGEAAKQCGIPDPIIRSTSKLDGVACKYLPEPLLATRGDGAVGTDITTLLSKGLRIIGDESTEAVGEIVMPQAYFDEHLSEDFSNPRNVIAGIVNANDHSEAALKALNEGAVQLVLYRDMKAIEMPLTAFSKQHKEVELELRNCEYPIDGVVFEVVSPEIKKLMGSNSHHHNWQIAAKQNEEAVQTTVVAVTYGVGRSGVITPTVHVEPVNLSGAMTSKATGHHVGNILAKKVGVGAVVTLYRAGLVIPYLHEVIVPATYIDIPAVCPCCDGVVKLDGDQLFCINDDCIGRAESRIIHFFSTIKALLFGRKTVQKLVDNGYDSIEKVMKITHHQLVGCGLGDGQAANLIAEIDRVSSEPLNDYLLVGALGISNLGRGSAKKLLAEHSISALPTISSDQLIQIEGFGSLTSVSVADKLANSDTLKFLLNECRFNLVHTKEEIIKQKMVTASSTSSLAGKNVVFTGTCSMSRSQMNQYAESLGCVPQKSVNGETDYLVCGEKVGNSKIQAAQKKGAKVISEAEFKALA
ncbi:BRCT domain-containing protein [Vibrio sp. 1180_3]|uniref:BRCT domain-containing protein n=1 Tax=Vibrio sp. 1180_3 TaxID=2528832 RepID=UPI002404F332|nr:BRCT domain-containing protein [Vibrio sp. 1180_3]MDF9399077.1 hypothetical protein [Vibrio sp. 1180_3]